MGEEAKSIIGAADAGDGTVQNLTIGADAGGGAGGGEETTVQTTQAAEVDFTKYIKPNGELSEGWKNLLPENIRGERCLDNIKLFPALAQSYVHAQKAIGANKVVLPGANATEEEKAAFFTAIGRPETAEKYEFKGQLPEGVVLDEAKAKAFKEYAFKNGFTQEAYNAAVAFDMERVAAENKAVQQAQEAEFTETSQKLQQEFGDKTAQVIAQCNKAVTTFGLLDVLQKNHLENNYSVIKALASIGEKISESKLKGDVTDSLMQTPQRRYDEIIGDPKGAYYNADNPLHTKVVNEVNELLKSGAVKPGI